MEREKRPPHYAEFRFYEELNDFLPPERKKRPFPYSFPGGASVKDAIEAMGVPHTEVDLIVVNGESAPFSYNLKEGDRVSVYPVFESFDIANLGLLRENPLRGIPRFVVDVHLGRLARYLRMMGFDTLYEPRYSDEDIAAIAKEDPGRIVLTMDRGLLKRAVITHGYCVRSQKWQEQLREVMLRCDLLDHVKPLSRCLACNGLIAQASKEEIAGSVPPERELSFESLTRCGQCGRVYWKGSHYVKMKKFIGDFLAGFAAGEGGQRGPMGHE
jgi:uncharacterized protein